MNIKVMDNQTLIEKALNGEYVQGGQIALMGELANRLARAEKSLKENTAPHTNKDHARGKFYAKQMEDFVNDIGMDREGFAETLLKMHRTNQQSFISLMLHCISEFATKGTTDMRNELGVKTCQKLHDFMEENYIATKLPMI